MKLTLKQVLDAVMGIKSVEPKDGSKKWSYAIAKNKRLLQPDVEGVNAAQKKYIAIEEERLEYCREHATKDATGSPITKNGMYIGINESDPVLKAIVAKINKANKDFDEFLKQEVEISLHVIPFADVPENIAPRDFENLSIMIEEPK